MTQREAPIQRGIVAYLRKVLPRDCIVHHSPNEHRRKPGKEAMLHAVNDRRAGVVKGFPDLIVLTYRGAYFFEVKAPKGYPSAEQKALHRQLEQMGYRVAVVRSVDDVRAALREWHFPTNEVTA